MTLLASIVALLFLACGGRMAPSAPSAPSTASSSQEAAPAIVGVQHFLVRDGQRISVWEKSPVGKPSAPVVVFVHGATWSGRPDFDLQIRDYSVMDAFVREGWSTFAIDIQGYGASDDPSEGNWSTAQDAAQDLAVLADWIDKERGIKSLSLLGWSWGAQIAGVYAMENPERVRRLVLQGFTWGRDREKRAAPTERFRSNTEAGAASDFIQDCYEQDVVDLYVEESMRMDPVSPNGVILDFAQHLPLVDPKRLTMPVMVAYGVHEVGDGRLEDGLNFYRELPSAERNFVIQEGGGHAILLEKPHRRWQRAMIDFLAD